MIKLIEIDLTKGSGHNHPDIILGETQYLAKIYGSFCAGRFQEVWFGLSFDGWANHLQFDTPGTNASGWEGLWEIHEFEKDCKNSPDGWHLAQENSSILACQYCGEIVK